MSARSFFSAALLSLLPMVSHGAELIDPAAFGFGRPGYMVDMSFVGGQSFDGRFTGTLEMSEIRTIIPVWKARVGEGGRFSTSLGYNLTQLNFDPGDRLDLHTIELQLGYFWNSPRSNWWGMGFVTPGLGTDFNGLSSDDFQISALGLLGYEFTPTFTIAAGAFGSYDHGDGRLLPALGFIWQPERWTFQATPPFLVIGYKISDPITVSLSAYPSGSSWDLDQNNGNNTLELSGWQSAATLIWKATKNLTVSVRGGVNFGGSFEIRDEQDRVLADENLDPAAFGALNVRWSF